MKTQTMLGLGALLGGLAVGAGAFGAHALEDLEEKRRLAFETAARYHMYHALALVLCGVLAQRGYRCGLAAWGFLLGTLLFSGSLYALVLLDVSRLGAITPIGGVLFLLGWVGLCLATWRRQPRP